MIDWPPNTVVVLICILVGQQSFTFFDPLAVVFGLTVSYKDVNVTDLYMQLGIEISTVYKLFM